MSNKDHKQRSVAPAETADRPSRQKHFLTRWSKRKAGSARRQGAPENLVAKVTEEMAPPSSPALKEAEEKSDTDMPPIESLDANSDYSQFLSPKVSERLRRAALRKLFHQPQYNVMDGLDTYIADCRNYTPLGDIITADMRYQMERQANEALAGLPEKVTAAVTTDDKTAVPVAKAEAATPTTDRQLGQPPVKKSGQRRTETDQGSLPARTNPANGRGTSS